MVFLDKIYWDLDYILESKQNIDEIIKFIELKRIPRIRSFFIVKEEESKKLYIEKFDKYGLMNNENPEIWKENDIFYRKNMTIDSLKELITIVPRPSPIKPASEGNDYSYCF